MRKVQGSPSGCTEDDYRVHGTYSRPFSFVFDRVLFVVELMPLLEVNELGELFIRFIRDEDIVAGATFEADRFEERYSLLVLEP